MIEARKFYTRPKLIEAIQWDGQNKKEVRNFIMNKGEEKNRLSDSSLKGNITWMEKGIWMLVETGDWICAEYIANDRGKRDTHQVHKMWLMTDTDFREFVLFEEEEEEEADVLSISNGGDNMTQKISIQRQQQILDILEMGDAPLSTAQIAWKMNISSDTARLHLNNLFVKHLVQRKTINEGPGGNHWLWWTA